MIKNKLALCFVIALITSHCLGKPTLGEVQLRRAAARGDNEKIKKLLNQGVDVNAGRIKGNPALRTALPLAVKAGHVSTINLLLDRGADTRCALIIAIRNGAVDIVKLLLDRGANPLGSCRVGIGIFEFDRYAKSPLSTPLLEANIQRRRSIKSDTKKRYDEIIKILEEAIKKHKEKDPKEHLPNLETR